MIKLQSVLDTALSSGRLVATKSSDLLLALFIVAVIALMILPLPLLLIDTLVAANIALGIMLVMMSIYVNSALQFTAFPSVLLISTLFRLALSVATTRMILLNGDAGEIIDTFGQLVAGGNMVVGLVVFLIITLVQFLVIAKGSERVAEVGARFTLDAMPGKQLSIDSDLRSGLIDKTEARKKRADLETESQLHGSLDGAMKFVKGDAIAGIVIIIVNLLGGLAVGVFQLNMSAGVAMQKYSILTIGDGLVAQIPALFGAMAAGLIVTRVSDSGPKQHLGEAIQSQFAAIPRVIIVAGGMCILFSVIPGFPTGVFIAMGFAMLATGGMLIPTFRIFMSRKSAPVLDRVLKGSQRSHRSHIKQTATVVGEQTSPLVLCLPSHLANDGLDLALQDELEAGLTKHNADSGIRLPTVQFIWHEQTEERWWLELFDVSVCGGPLPSNQAINVADLSGQCMLAIRKNIRLFVGLEETAQLLNRCSNESPEVVREVQHALSLQGLTVIIRNLAEEEVPLRYLSLALGAILEASQNENDLANLTEYARISLGRQISNKYSNGSVVKAIGLSFQLEEYLLSQLRTGSGGSELSIAPALSNEIAKGLHAILESANCDVIVCPVVLRRHIRAWILQTHFHVGVLSYPEIAKPFALSISERLTIKLDNLVDISQPASGAA